MKVAAMKPRGRGLVEFRRQDHSVMPTHVAAGRRPLLETMLRAFLKAARGVLSAFVLAGRLVLLVLALGVLAFVVTSDLSSLQQWFVVAVVVVLVASWVLAAKEARLVQAKTEPTKVHDDDLKMNVNMNVNMNTVPVVIDTPKPTTARRNSGTLELGAPKLTVVQCGTVIDLQGSRGLLIPHTLSLAMTKKSTTKTPSAFPMVLPFDLHRAVASLRQELAVGQIVEFSYTSNDSDEIEIARVTPVEAEQEIEKSRNAMQCCKQAREKSFAKAMASLPMISPRHEPVKQYVDLIEYAQHLDDDDGDYGMTDAFI